jgi:hypothetical protein
VIEAGMLILDELPDELRAACATFFHERKGGGGIDSMADIGLAAFSLFFMRVESFLSLQRSREEGQRTSCCHIAGRLDGAPGFCLHSRIRT